MLLLGGSSTNAAASGIPPQKAAWQRIADKTLPPGALISFLQKGLQYVGIEETLLQQQQQQDGAKKAKSRNDQNESDVGIPETSTPADFSLLSAATIQALSRRNPPINLTVPPAAAAAAVRARLEAEAAARDSEVTSVMSSSDANLLAQQAIVVQQAAAAAAMTQQLHFQQQQQQQQLILTQQLEEVAKAGAKRGVQGNASTGKRGKKQKTKDANKGFASLEQAMAQLEATKKIKSSDSHATSQSPSEVDGTTNQIESKGRHDQDLVNGENEHNRNGEKRDNGDESIVSERQTRPVVPPLDENEMEEEEIEADEAEETGDQLFAASPEEVLILDKHVSEVFMCAWNPVFTNLIATGSGDASARIWEMNDMHARSGLRRCTELPHGIETGDKKNKDVTTLEWSSSGQLLATGSYDGIARVWDRDGALIQTLRGHQGPIFSLKWNRRGNFLLSASYDKTIIVWNVSAITSGDVVDSNAKGYIEHQYRHHEAPALDVDWKDDTTFASCSTDKTVHIYKVNIDTPIKIYRGHKDEVNAVKWDPSGKYLASCSDDCTAKVWEVDNDREEAMRDFKSHNQEIYTMKWSPTGGGSANPDKSPLLATASFDGSIRLWNIHDGSCFRFLNRHKNSVYSVAFSPSGKYLASGALAGQLYIWNIYDNTVIKSYKGFGDIFEVAWNKEETRVAACFSSNIVAVVDFDESNPPIPPNTENQPNAESPSKMET
jgi:transducin (beta)-like 1